ncbi:MAG TPA: OmpA family protein [Hyphomicrobiaceae bacterium]|nr:OmpA family protein [Hyphomicrobiaceae bacterium]
MRNTHVVWLSAAALPLLAATAVAQTKGPAPSGPPPVVAPAGAPTAPAAAPKGPTAVSYEEALLSAANNLLSKAVLPPGDKKLQVVIDPLIDGQTGHVSPTTQRIGRRITDLIKTNYPRLEVVAFTPENVAKKPLLLIGTFTAINLAGKADAPKDAYRLCLALGDLNTGKLVSKGVGFMKAEQISVAPTPSFADAPVWTKDKSIEGYVKTCQGTKVDDPINAAYVDRIATAAMIADAMAAYDAKRWPDSLKRFQAALAAPGGDQLRVHNGIYLANWKLGRKKEAAEAFAKVIDHGLTTDRLAVLYLFRPGSTSWAAVKGGLPPYAMWTDQIAKRTEAKKACLEIVGHSSRSGNEDMNVRLSGRRADLIRDRLVRVIPALNTRVIASGVGSKEAVVGTMPDSAANNIDRRVEFKVAKCS